MRPERRGVGNAAAAIAVTVGLTATVVAPVIAALGRAAGDADAPPDFVPVRPLGALLGETAAFALLVTAGAVLLGWIPGRVLGRGLGRRAFAPLATLLLVPMCVPAYVVFYAWWQAWPPDSALHAWAIDHGHIGSLRRLTVIIALVAWSWPIVAWCVAGGVRSARAEHEEMMALDGAGVGARLVARAREDARALALGALLVFLATFGNTTCFDLAQVFTFGNELRAMDAAGAGVRAVLVASAPAVALAAVGAIVVWVLLGVRPPSGAARRVRPAAAGPTAVAVAIAAAGLAPPVLAVLRQVSDATAVRRFAALYGPALADTALLAACSAALAAALAIALAVLWLAEGRWARGLAHATAIGLFVTALAPATVVGAGLEAAYNQSVRVWPLRAADEADSNRPLAAGASVSDVTLADLVYRRRSILVLGHLARFGFVAALLGRWLATREPRELAELRRVDGAATARAALGALGPRALAAGAAAAAIVFALAAGEIPVTARVHPPASDPLPVVMLNAMHYQRPETVMIALGALLSAALAAAALTTLACLSRPVRRGIGGAAAALAVATLVGCGDVEAGMPRPLEAAVCFGSNGTALGQFSYPRALAVDVARQRLFIVDKTARVQRWTFDGRPELEWAMPAKDNGKPTGISVAPDGRVFVADTHYFRIMAFDGEGREVLRFGGHGEGPGQFIYPTDVAFGPQGRLYVSEYGGHDRVQVFSPRGEYLFEFGRPGAGDGELNRPQALVFNEQRTELYIADSCNHRIVVVDPTGRVQRTFGTPGRGPGELHYPYGLALLDDGTLVVSEFGNNRLQRFRPDGTPVEIRGCLGAGPGELRYPWAVGVADDWLFVLDSGNNRVQRVRAH